MKMERVKNINITVLFSTPINHLLISQKGILDSLKSGDIEKDKHTSLEAPGLKVLILPNRRKEFVFEGVRILINDKTGKEPKDSDIMNDFQKIMESIEQNKIVAYGFNYDATIIPSDTEAGLSIDDLVGTKIAKIPNIKSAGVNISLEEAGTSYVLEIKPIGSESKFIAHFNAHFKITDKLPSSLELKKQIISQFNKFKEIIKKI